MRTTDRGDRRGFTFTEILVGLCVLTLGIIPVVHALMGGTRQTGISLRQVQAANHASNLMEALQAFGFRNVVRLPSTMVQQRGGENKWEVYQAGMELGFEGLAESRDQAGDTVAFDEFQGRFFADPPVVPPLENVFTRYFHLIRDAERRYVTAIVRVEWTIRVPGTDGGQGSALRFVELRTVFADPYQGGSSS